jgi:hypothetical protein
MRAAFQEQLEMFERSTAGDLELAVATLAEIAEAVADPALAIGPKLTEMARLAGSELSTATVALEKRDALLARRRPTVGTAFLGSA